MRHKGIPVKNRNILRKRVMASSRKRPRSAVVATVKRPIDKELKVVNVALTNSQTTSTLKTTTFPCTVVGLRWSISAQSTLTTGASLVTWAIVVVHDGNSANTMATSDGADFYTPEQDVLTFGVARFPDSDAGNGPNVIQFEGATKTMRKLKQGDLLQLITLANLASVGVFAGVVQFFCKS